MEHHEDGVSIVIPLYNAEAHIEQVLKAVLEQDFGGALEIIVVNDGSTDRSSQVITPFEAAGKIHVINQENQGAAAATNRGFLAARYRIICSIDSDVVLDRNWLRTVLEEFKDPDVGAVQGYYRTPDTVSFWARMMGYDVEKRYDDIPDKYVTQVCTGDTAYRKNALDRVGLFDTAFRYGYDNDMSYRLLQAGYRLVFRKDAQCDHYWKADIKSYIRQQYRSAYGRMQLVSKHQDKITGDSVSGLRMILQVPITLVAMLLLAAAAFSSLFPGHSTMVIAMLGTALVLLAVLLADRTAFTIPIIRKHKDATAVFLPFVHLLRNAVWTWALLGWLAKKSGIRS
ncbi:MAG: hypothetical protein A2010_12415 [Nitrospirae bacterium GWD2_57_9]|nr:MAG: hypothetical protein A2010_12415 [Nitrospirae bacterium GWD2_57_9]